MTNNPKSSSYPYLDVTKGKSSILPKLMSAQSSQILRKMNAGKEIYRVYQ